MDMISTVELHPIGVVRNTTTAPKDDYWGGVVSTIELDQNQFTEDSLNGIDEFSHLEVIYLMHLVEEASVPRGARRPRNLSHLPLVGILAQRPKARPNRLGLSRCRLLGRSALTLTVQDLDAIDGSPVLDIKPYFREFAPRGDVRQPSWPAAILQHYYENGQG